MAATNVDVNAACGQGLPEDDRVGARISAAQHYPQGVELFRQGQSLREVVFIERGLIKLTRLDRHGRDVTVELVFAGAWLGTAPVITGRPTPVSAITCSEVLAKRMLATTFCDRLRNDSAFALEIQRAQSAEWYRHTDWIGHLGSLTARQRLQSVIREFVAALRPSASTQSVRLQLPLRHWEVASLIAVRPEHLSRLLKGMQAEGLLRREKGWIVIPDVQNLYEEDETEKLSS